MSPMISPKTAAEADVVSLMAFGGILQTNEAVKFEFESFFIINTDCVMDLGIPSGSTLNFLRTLSPANAPIAST